MRPPATTRLAARLLPREFRRDFLEDLETTWGEARRQEGGGPSGSETWEVLRLALALRWRWLRDREHAARAMVLTSAVGLFMGSFLPASLWATTRAVGQAGSYAGPSPTMRLAAVALGVACVAALLARSPRSRSVPVVFGAALVTQAALAVVARLHRPIAASAEWDPNASLIALIAVLSLGAASLAAAASWVPTNTRPGLMALPVAGLSGAVALAALRPSHFDETVGVHLASAGPALLLAALAFSAAALSAFTPPRVQSLGLDYRPGGSR